MELTQQEIKWIKDRFAQEEALTIAVQKDAIIQSEREKVAKKHEKKLKKLADEGKIEERKALIEQITKEANEAEETILNSR